MKIEEYQALAMRTSPEGHDRILNGCLGLIGESGEIVDVVKKWKFQSGENAELPKDKLIDECGDVLWYCAEACHGFEIDMGRVIYEAREVWPFLGNINCDDLPYWAYILSSRCSLIYSQWYSDYGKFHGKNITILEKTILDLHPPREKRIEADLPIAYPAKINEVGYAASCFFNTTAYPISVIVMTVQHFLQKFADSSLEEAMEHNIEKLKKRYPDGFDPERSLHRNE